MKKRGNTNKPKRLSKGKQPVEVPQSVDKPEYIAYPKAIRLLADRLDATQEEMAAWVFIGPKMGGLTAYTNVAEIEDPPKFSYGNYVGTYSTADIRAGKVDYIAPLMGSHFTADEISKFHPAERYITGKSLIERWNQQPHITRPKAFILKNISESRLMDCHPIYGGTEATFGENFPPLETGLFPLSQVEAIEASDFGISETEKNREAKVFPIEQTLADSVRNNNNESNKKPKRSKDDALALEINAILRMSPTLSSSQVKSKLRDRVGIQNSQVVGSVSGGLKWERDSGETVETSYANIDKRIARWKSKHKNTA